MGAAISGHIAKVKTIPMWFVSYSMGIGGYLHFLTMTWGYGIINQEF